MNEYIKGILMVCAFSLFALIAQTLLETFAE